MGEDVSGAPPELCVRMGQDVPGACGRELARMRGYPTSRFYDKAAIYHTAELRMIPEWNPLGAKSDLEWLEVDWIMFVPFIEIGRVSE